MFLLKYHKAKHREMLEEIKVAPSTLSYHLQKLVRYDLVHYEDSTGERIYQLKDKEQTISFLIRYKPFNVVEGFKDIWMDLGID
jgi:Mn-dependent DtxR family transcriptional regulator